MMTSGANVDEGPSVDLVAEQAAAKAVVDMWLQVWETKDMALFDRIFSHDPDMIIFGTDEAEYWVGYEMARKSVEHQLGVFGDTEGTVRNQVVKVHASGEVAWFTEMMDMGVTSGGERMNLTIWFSGVLEKRAGTWTFVQFHASVPVAGQAIEY